MDSVGRFETPASETKNHLMLRRQAAARGSASASLPQAPPLPQQQDGQRTSTHVRPKHRKLWAQGTCIFSMERKPAWILVLEENVFVILISKQTYPLLQREMISPPSKAVHCTNTLWRQSWAKAVLSFVYRTCRNCSNSWKTAFQHPHLFSLDFEVIYLL